MLEMTQSGITGSSTVTAINENGSPVDVVLVEERPLTLFIDRQEVVTLMTMGSFPELLVLGYLKNQNFFTEVDELKAVQVDWQTQAVAVVSNLSLIHI